jgi:hypothetical protein
MPPDAFLHERSDLKALVETVADGEKINDPALVEKDYWIMQTLFGLKQLDLTFELKGGTSLSKGFRVIHRFSEDIDICIEPFDGLRVDTNPNHEKPQHIESRRQFYEKLRDKIKISGITAVERDTTDDDETLRNAGRRLSYETHFGSIAGLKHGILLEVGFDQTAPNRAVTTSSWTVQFDETKKLRYTDNRAVEVPCYNPEDTFVEKVQAVVSNTGNRKRRESSRGTSCDTTMISTSFSTSKTYRTSSGLRNTWSTKRSASSPWTKTSQKAEPSPLRTKTSANNSKGNT